MRCQTPNGKWTGWTVLSFREVITETHWFRWQAENISKSLLQLIIKLLMICWLIVHRLTITAKSILCFRITLCWTAAGLGRGPVVYSDERWRLIRLEIARLTPSNPSGEDEAVSLCSVRSTVCLSVCLIHLLSGCPSVFFLFFQFLVYFVDLSICYLYFHHLQFETHFSRNFEDLYWLLFSMELQKGTKAFRMSILQVFFFFYLTTWYI